MVQGERDSLRRNNKRGECGAHTGRLAWGGAASVASGRCTERDSMGQNGSVASAYTDRVRSRQAYSLIPGMLRVREWSECGAMSFHFHRGWFGDFRKYATHKMTYTMQKYITPTCPKHQRACAGSTVDPRYAPEGTFLTRTHVHAHAHGAGGAISRSPGSARGTAAQASWLLRYWRLPRPLRALPWPG